MRALLSLVLLAVTFATTHALQSGEADPEPVDLGQQEQVEVRLVLIDAVVLDGQDRTVPDLKREDFEVTVDGKRLPIDTLDASCAAGSVDDPEAVRDPKRRATISSSAQRNIVLALDYLHLTRMERVDVLEQARSMVRHGMTPNDRIMLAALNGGLRIEQVFTADHERILDALKRMEYDISLWEPSFSHLNEDPFFDGLQVLFDVLSSVPGNKGVVLFSNNPSAAQENDLTFADLAAAASAARCSLYPVHASGLIAARPG